MRRTARIMLGVGSGLAVLAALTSCASTPPAPAPSNAASPPATTAAAPEINGTLTYTVPFNPDAEYYSVTVSTTTSSSHVSCEIIAVGPSPDAPLTVSSASATGQNECDAQAAPEDSTGETWQKEG